MFEQVRTPVRQSSVNSLPSDVRTTIAKLAMVPLSEIAIKFLITLLKCYRLFEVVRLVRAFRQVILDFAIWLQNHSTFSVPF